MIFKFRTSTISRLWRVVLLLGVLFFIRWTKGAAFVDFYSTLSLPFWPGSAQKELLLSSSQAEQVARLSLLETDNKRLRKLLSLERKAKGKLVSAAVISRKTNGWWQQFQLNKGLNSGIKIGNPVLGPGGLLGLIHSVTPTTSRVRLLTAPGSRIGVWLARSKNHGLLVGLGTSSPQLLFFDKNLAVVPGDLVSTSPVSTLVPPNIFVGTVKSLDLLAHPAPYALVQLSAIPDAIDWVQVDVSK